MKEHNYCYKHDDNTCNDCDLLIKGVKCGFYCHRCECPNCSDNFAALLR